jgi:sRNA-binding protein
VKAPPPPAPAAPPAPPKAEAKPAAPPAPEKKPAAPEKKAEAPAPAKAEPPKLPPAPAPEKKPEAPAKKTSSLDRGLRTWTDRTGQHRLVAQFVSVLEGDVVRLQRDDGTYVRVAIERLSVGDRQYVNTVRGALAAR